MSDARDLNGETSYQSGVKRYKGGKKIKGRLIRRMQEKSWISGLKTSSDGLHLIDFSRSSKD